MNATQTKLRVHIPIQRIFVGTNIGIVTLKTELEIMITEFKNKLKPNGMRAIVLLFMSLSLANMGIAQTATAPKKVLIDI